ncbi:MobQ family relaxase [Klebsiella sp. Kpp]|uniref:MobQ family relaxase n=1 Tax=Klebsiella sp. Kpp TaxID=2758578 RepID=UPI001643E4EA|nr:MobQ family relaxase [Klebsiella sp. Kpp]MBC3627306.1 MobA/MobL family protein [Klebsiella sp. Kpp]
MAIYYFDVSNVSRNSGKKSASSVAAAAYQNRARYTDERTGTTYDYTKKGGLYYSGILSPENAPESLTASPLTLWNTVEGIEKRKDARLAKDFKISLLIELTPEQNKALILDFAKQAFVSKGMIVDLAIHDIDTQPHSHIKTTTRELTPEGFGGKVREWDKKETILYWRELWAKVANEHLLKAGHDITISHLTLKKQMKEALEEMDKTTDLEEKIKLASKAIELNRPAMKTISKKDWGDPKFQEIRKQEQEAKKQILKKAKNFRIKNTRELKEIQTELNKKFRPSKIYKSISEAIRNLNNKITDSKLNNILNDKLDKLTKAIISIPENRKIKREKKIREKELEEEKRIFRETHKMDEFGNIYKKEDSKKWNKENNKLIKQQTASNKAKAEEERERKKLEDEANRLAEKNNISPNDFKQKKKKGLSV